MKVKPRFFSFSTRFGFIFVLVMKWLNGFVELAIIKTHRLPPLPSTTTFHVRLSRYIKKSIREFSWFPLAWFLVSLRSIVLTFGTNFFSVRGNVCRSYSGDSTPLGLETVLPIASSFSLIHFTDSRKYFNSVMHLSRQLLPKLRFT